MGVTLQWDFCNQSLQQGLQTDRDPDTFAVMGAKTPVSPIGQGQGGLQTRRLVMTPHHDI